MKRNIKIASIAFVLFIALTTSAFAIVYKLQQSNDATITVNSQVVGIAVNLTPAAATITEGQQVQLTAIIADVNGNGKTIHFMEGATEVGAAVITGQQASIILTPTAGVHTYHTAAEP